MRIKVVTGIGMISLLFCLTGCGNTIPEMDEQQEKLVVEYMAGTLLKYDTNHVSKLTQLPIEQEEPEELPAQAEEELPGEDIGDEVQTEALEGVEEPTAMEEPVVVFMDEFLGLEGVSIQHAGYVVTDFYPEQGSEFYFVMDASEGNKLLVLKFEAENTSMEDRFIDLAIKNVRYKIRVNGDEKNALNTMLMNDLRYYQGTIAGGGKEELVLVREIPAEWENEIDALELVMQDSDYTAVLSFN